MKKKQLKRWVRVVLLSVLIVNALSAYAASVCSSAKPCLSPVGNWLTIDDKTHKPRGVINIIEKTDSDGRVTLMGSSKFGFYMPGLPWSKYYKGTYKPFYHKAFGTFPIMWNYVSQGNGKWGKGTIFDPDHSKTYHSYIQLQDNGNQLKVSGCIAFLCRGQVWLRLSQVQYDAYHQQSQEDLKRHPMTD